MKIALNPLPARNYMVAPQSTPAFNPALVNNTFTPHMPTLNVVAQPHVPTLNTVPQPHPGGVIVNHVPNPQPNSRESIENSWRSYFDQSAKTFFPPYTIQIGNDEVPAGSDAANWRDVTLAENNGFDFWLGFYKNPINGSIMGQDDNGDVVLFDRTGKFVAMGANVDGKATGFFANW